MKKTLLISLLIINIVYSQSIYFPPNDNSTWQTISPATLGWNSQKLDELKTFLQGENTKAFIVLKDGKIAVEWYFGTFKQDSIWYWASAGKTLTAFLIGKAQEEKFLSINDTTSKYLGVGWTSISKEKEAKISIWHQLTMTSGLDDKVPDNHCTSKSCLTYLANAGTRWAYHNAPYTLLEQVIEKSTGQSINNYTALKLKNTIGLTGAWFTIDYDNVFFSKPRSMARYGLLAMNNFVWDREVLLNNQQYISALSSTSQQLNKSYGYLWWLNGKGSYMLPTIQLVFNTNIMPNAPNDMFAGLGKNDQKVYVIKSMGLVAIRMGNAADNPMLAISSFDNELWGEIKKVIGYSTSVENNMNLPSNFSLEQNYPNPFNPTTVIKYQIPTASHVTLKVFDVLGREVATLVDEYKPAGNHSSIFSPGSAGQVLHSSFSSGVYFFQLKAGNYVETKKMVFAK